MAGEPSGESLKPQQQEAERFDKLHEVLKRAKKEKPKQELNSEQDSKAKVEAAKERAEKEETAEKVEGVRGKIEDIEQGEKPKITKEDKTLVDETAKDTKTKLADNVKRGFGATPDGKRGIYSDRVFMRDAARAAEDYFADANPQVLTDSLNTILKYQRADGALPSGVERAYLPLKMIPGLDRLAKPLFSLIEGRIRGRQERPVYAGKTWYGEEDAIPATIIAAGKLCASSEAGKEFTRQHFDQLTKAVEFTNHKVDSEDGLIECQQNGPDWQNSINRGGKLGGVNILWARSLESMATMARELGREDDAKLFHEQYEKVKDSIMAKIYNKEEGYFKASTEDSRLDTVASIQGALHLLDIREAARVEQTLADKVKHKSGLVNFDRPYEKTDIKLWHRAQGIPDYHNKDSWPWVTCENIMLKVKIGQEHPELAVREQFKSEAVADLVDVSELFKDAGGAYEVFKPDTRKPEGNYRYRAPKNFMGSMAAFEGAHSALQKAGWL